MAGYQDDRISIMNDSLEDETKQAGYEAWLRINPKRLLDKAVPKTLLLLMEQSNS
jgi:hypothetical protein